MSPDSLPPPAQRKPIWATELQITSSHISQSKTPQEGPVNAITIVLTVRPIVDGVEVPTNVIYPIDSHADLDDVINALVEAKKALPPDLLPATT